MSVLFTYFVNKARPILTIFTRTIIRGILRSHNFVDLAQNIPNSIIQTLENDADAAKEFITQIQNGQVPDLIKDLPQEIIDSFTDVLNIVKTLPSEILNVAEAAVTDVVDVANEIENGTIISEIEKLPSEVASVVTQDWGEFTAGIVHGWNDFTCFFKPKPCPGSLVTTTSINHSAPSTAVTASAPLITPHIVTPTPLPTRFDNTTRRSTALLPTSTVVVPNTSVRTTGGSYASYGVWASTFIMITVLGLSALL